PHEILIGIGRLCGSVGGIDVELSAERKPEAFGFLCEPFAGKLGQGIVEISAADIGMRAGEPSLLGAFDRAARRAGRALVAPKGRRERLALLVDRERMKSELVVLAQPGIEKFVGRSKQPVPPREGD